MAMKRVAVLPFPGIEGAYVCVSGQQKPTEYFGQKWYAKGSHAEYERQFEDRNIKVTPKITFMAVVGTVCAEWDGEHGPIQMAFSVPADHKGSDWQSEPKPHWFFDQVISAGHWSQLAVENAGLPEAFNAGNYEHIFHILRSWADRPNEYLAPVDEAAS